MGRVRRQRGSRTGTLLVLSGVVGVLTVTFVAGVWTGRHWPLLAGSGGSPSAPAEAPAGRRGPAEKPRQAEPLPALTFYHELTAPLTAPPPVPKPTRPPRPPEPRREAEKPEPASATTPPTASGPALPAPTPTTHAAGAGFTIQVGAYNVRAPAETLRATLAAAGHDARVVEAETRAGVRYRVHVGSFATREAAKETATRLAAERSLPAFVTPR